jgi:hypothetical protein
MKYWAGLYLEDTQKINQGWSGPDAKDSYQARGGERKVPEGALAGGQGNYHNRG